MQQTPDLNAERAHVLERYREEIGRALRGAGLVFGDDQALLQLKAEEFVDMLSELTAPRTPLEISVPKDLVLEADSVGRALQEIAEKAFGEGSRAHAARTRHAAAEVLHFDARR